MIASLKGKLWLTYCAWFRAPLKEKLRRDFSTQLPPRSEFHAEVADFLASTGQSKGDEYRIYRKGGR